MDVIRWKSIWYISGCIDDRFKIEGAEWNFGIFFLFLKKKYNSLLFDLVVYIILSLVYFKLIKFCYFNVQIYLHFWRIR